MFTEKDARGGSALYPISQFKKKQLEQLQSDLEKGYLQGRFGAIPLIDEVDEPAEGA